MAETNECQKAMITDEIRRASGRNLRQPERPIDSQELLLITKRIDQFVTDNGWSWCTMRKVYEILVACHG